MEIENIKFKAKSLNSGKWIEGDLIRKSNGIYIKRHKYLSAIVDASTVCQFTGLTDKNGAPIYEGDIVMHKDNNAERSGDINWDSKAAAFCFGQDFLFHYSSEDMVVIGNKFDKKKK
jgi:uncharacterized phage protein (TIGR01671 family)